jgi:hypothetical protein
VPDVLPTRVQPEIYGTVLMECRQDFIAATWLLNFKLCSENVFADPRLTPWIGGIIVLHQLS